MKTGLRRALPSLILASFIIFTIAAAVATRAAYAADEGDVAHSADNKLLTQVVAGFSNGWNSHDAHAMCASLAADVHWVSWRGEVSSSRKKVEDQHTVLFAGLYKNTHRTDTVKSIHYLTPELASVDDFWTMTGAKTRAGEDWPYRAGCVNFTMTKRAGRWIVIAAHTADFNAKAPAGN
jgi:uncharacterized protein (TIGR02246 family)